MQALCLFFLLTGYSDFATLRAAQRNLERIWEKKPEIVGVTVPRFLILVATLCSGLWVVSLPTNAHAQEELEWQSPNGTPRPNPLDAKRKGAAANEEPLPKPRPTASSAGVQTPPRTVLPATKPLPPSPPTTTYSEADRTAGDESRVVPASASFAANSAFDGTTAEPQRTNNLVAQASAFAQGSQVQGSQVAGTQVPGLRAADYALAVNSDPYAIAPASYAYRRPWFSGGLFAPPQPIMERLWIRGEYLSMIPEGFRVPALVTSSPVPTARAQAGVLGFPNTRVLYGDDEINDELQNGGRLKLGLWLDQQRQIGIQADYLQLFGDGDSFNAASDGTAIIARPFFDITQGLESSSLVSYPGLVRGSISVVADTDYRTFGFSGRANVSEPGEYANVMMIPAGGRTDWFIGYRYAQLSESLTIREDLDSFGTVPPGLIETTDAFETDNVFHGLELGINYTNRRNRLWLETLAKIAVGNMRQTVNINGFSDITEAGVRDRFQGGILAQRTNIGSYARDEVAVIPELSATIGLQVTPRFSLTLGYTFLYVSNVVRPGDQIDTDLNPNLFPPAAPPIAGAARPRPFIDDTDFWMHGLAFGGDFRF